jgi:hypothetical protein
LLWFCSKLAPKLPVTESWLSWLLLVPKLVPFSTPDVEL